MMQHIWEFIQQFFHPKSIIEYGGLGMLLFVIFAETGLFFGFFLPGDSLLFISGLLSATYEDPLAHGPHIFNVSIFVLIPSLFVAAVLGNFTGYYFGLRAGNVLLHRRDTLFFKKRYIDLASDFYHKRGGTALILGRFLPIIRTFVPIFAGIVRLDIKKFAFYNISGGFLWISILTLAGYFLGKRYRALGDHLEIVVILLIILSIIPVGIAFIRNKIKSRNSNTDNQQEQKP